MNIFWFKLINRGYNGVEVKYNEIVKGEKISLKDGVRRVRKTPIPTNVRVHLDKLKYAFMNCSGHWMQPFNKYFNIEDCELKPIPLTGDMPMGQDMLRKLWNKITITEVKFNEASFEMKAECEIITGKPQTYKIGPIIEEDDFSFFIETMGILDDLMIEMAEFIQSHALPAPDVKVFLEQTSKLTQEEIDKLSEEEQMDRAIELLSKNGAVVIFDEQLSIDSGEPNSDKDKVEVKKINGGGIDSNHVHNKEDHFEKENDDSEEKVIETTAENAEQEIKENIVVDETEKEPEVVNPYGLPASENTDFPVAPDEQVSGNVSSDEFSDTAPISEDDVPSDIADEINNW